MKSIRSAHNSRRFGTSLGLGKDKAEVRDIAGCLSQSDSAKEFLLTGNDGSTWEVRSNKVALAKQVGHTATATGVVSNATTLNMKKDANADDADCRASDLMVCKRVPSARGSLA